MLELRNDVKSDCVKDFLRCDKTGCLWSANITIAICNHHHTVFSDHSFGLLTETNTNVWFGATMQFLPISRYLGYTQSATGGNPSDAVGLAVAARSVIAAECIAIICTDSPNVNKKIKIFHKHRNLLFQKDSVVITNGIDRPTREWLY